MDLTTELYRFTNLQVISPTTTQSLATTGKGPDIFKNYLQPYFKTARDNSYGFVLESLTWRANPDWTTKLGYSTEQFVDLDRRAIELMEDIRASHKSEDSPIVLSGCGSTLARSHPGYSR